MSRETQIEELKKDLTDIFDEEYYRRNITTPQNTAEKLAKKGYRKQSDVSREIFEEIEQNFEIGYGGVLEFRGLLAELKKKYTEENNNDKD